MNKQIEENIGCCNSCIHRFVCFQCDDDTLVCSQYKDEGDYRKASDVASRMTNFEKTLALIGERDLIIDQLRVERKDLKSRILTELCSRIECLGDLKPFVLWEDIEAVINDILEE